jgi:hypothetical protein
MPLPQSAAWVPLHNSERSIPPGAKWLGPLDPSEPLIITIRLRPETGKTQGAKPSDLARIQQFAREAGLDIIEMSPAHGSAVVWGTAAVIAGAFRVRIAYYEYAGKVRRGQIGPVYLPPTISHVVEEVSGIDDGFPTGTSTAGALRRVSEIPWRRMAVPVAGVLIGTALSIVLFRVSASDRSSARRTTPAVHGAAAHRAGAADAHRYATAREPQPALRALTLVKAGLSPARQLEAWREPAAAVSPARASAPSGPARRPRGDGISTSERAPGPTASRAKPPRAQTSGVSTLRLPDPADSGRASPRTAAPAAQAGQRQPVAAPAQQYSIPRSPAVAQDASSDPPPARSAPVPLLTPSPAPTGGSTGTPANRLYMVRIGPVVDRNRAAAIAKQLSAGGFAQAQVSAQTAYQVLSEPLPRQVAERLQATLAARGVHSAADALTGDTVQLSFGRFGSQKDAEAFSTRIAAAGYDAWIREMPAYTVRLGPYPQAAVATITDIVRSSAPDIPVAADDVSSSVRPAPRAAAPQARWSPQAAAATEPLSTS